MNMKKIYGIGVCFLLCQSAMLFGMLGRTGGRIAQTGAKAGSGAVSRGAARIPGGSTTSEQTSGQPSVPKATGPEATGRTAGPVGEPADFPSVEPEYITGESPRLWPRAPGGRETIQWFATLTREQQMAYLDSGRRLEAATGKKDLDILMSLSDDVRTKYDKKEAEWFQQEQQLKEQEEKWERQRVGTPMLSEPGQPYAERQKSLTGEEPTVVIHPPRVTTPEQKAATEKLHEYIGNKPAELTPEEMVEAALREQKKLVPQETPEATAEREAKERAAQAREIEETRLLELKRKQEGEAADLQAREQAKEQARLLREAKEEEAEQARREAAEAAAQRAEEGRARIEAAKQAQEQQAKEREIKAQKERKLKQLKDDIAEQVKIRAVVIEQEIAAQKAEQAQKELQGLQQRVTDILEKIAAAELTEEALQAMKSQLEHMGPQIEQLQRQRVEAEQLEVAAAEAKKKAVEEARKEEFRRLAQERIAHEETVRQRQQKQERGSEERIEQDLRDALKRAAALAALIATGGLALADTRRMEASLAQENALIESLKKEKEERVRLAAERAQAEKERMEQEEKERLEKAKEAAAQEAARKEQEERVRKQMREAAAVQAENARQRAQLEIARAAAEAERLEQERLAALEALMAEQKQQKEKVLKESETQPPSPTRRPAMPPRVRVINVLPTIQEEEEAAEIEETGAEETEAERVALETQRAQEAEQKQTKAREQEQARLLRQAQEEAAAEQARQEADKAEAERQTIQIKTRADRERQEVAQKRAEQKTQLVEQSMDLLRRNFRNASQKAQGLSKQFTFEELPKLDMSLLSPDFAAQFESLRNEYNTGARSGTISSRLNSMKKIGSKIQALLNQ